MRVWKIVIITIVVVLAAMALFHGCVFHGAFFLGLPYIHAGRLLRFLMYAGGAAVCFVVGADVRRTWLRIVLFTAGVMLSIWAVVNLAGAIY